MQPPSLRSLPVWLIVGVCIAVVLGSCKKQLIVELPDGPQTIMGVLKPAPLSIGRRGTHVFIQGIEEKYYVESRYSDETYR